MIRSRLRDYCALLIALGLGGCGGGDSTYADGSNPTLGTPVAGNTPFNATVSLTAHSLEHATAVSFTVDPKVGAAARPVSVTYTMDYLRRKGWLSTDGAQIDLKLFGLYAGRRNVGTVSIRFEDDSVAKTSFSFDAAAYVDPAAIYDRPTIRTPRAQGAVLGFDYFFMKSALGPPIVADTDGEIRWIGSGVASSGSSTFRDAGFVVGIGTTLYRVEFDGTSSVLAQVRSPSNWTYTDFHHNVDAGKAGILAELNATENGVSVVESILADVRSDGSVAGEWNLAGIVSREMQRGGDDPSLFVRAGNDWFHMNAATYDARDDSVIISGREDFVVKVDYSSGEIVWIFGDPTKYWYTFPSLRAKSLLLAQGLYPIGQHAVSLLPGGDLMLFNDGLGSTQQPAGASPGQTRNYSAVSAYTIDAGALSATQSWSFDYGQSVYSPVCSSAYQTTDGSTLVTYSTAENYTHARLVGLNPQHDVVFDIQYNSAPCATSWNSEPVPLEKLTFQ